MAPSIRSIFSDRLYLAQFFLVVAGAFSWNILGLARLVNRHKYLGTLDWWSILLVAGIVVLVAILGWIWAILSFRKTATNNKITRRLGSKVAFWSGGGVFLLGWVICIWLMMRLMNNEPWCLVGALGSMLEDWLPNGIIITGIIIVISFLTASWFLRFSPAPQLEIEE